MVDGGSLLQRLPWTFGSSFHQICSDYCNLVKANYGSAHVVFDGYCNGPSVKDVTHERRTKGTVGTRVQFDFRTPFKTKKETFLSNVENKQNFIDMLGNHLTEVGCKIV